MNTTNNKSAQYRARALAAAATATLALGLAACGGGDETGTSADASTDAELNAGDFILQLEDDKQATIEAIAAANPECEGVDTDRDFLLLVTAQATDLKPDEPIEPLIVDNCTP